jgi:hypothetical protein
LRYIFCPMKTNETIVILFIKKKNFLLNNFFDKKNKSYPYWINRM